MEELSEALARDVGGEGAVDELGALLAVLLFKGLDAPVGGLGEEGGGVHDRWQAAARVHGGTNEDVGRG